MKILICTIIFAVSALAQGPSLLQVKQESVAIQYLRLQQGAELKQQQSELARVVTNSAEYKKAAADLAQARLDAQQLFDAATSGNASPAAWEQARQSRSAAEAVAQDTFSKATTGIVPKGMPEYDERVSYFASQSAETSARIARQIAQCQAVLDSYKADHADAPTGGCQ